MLLLAASILALGLGPLLGKLLRRSQASLHLLDGFVFTSLVYLALGHLLPELLHEGGAWILLSFGFGLFFPGMLESRFHQATKGSHGFLVGFVGLGLMIHSFLDGMALTGASGHSHLGEAANLASPPLLAWGVLLHRIPFSLMIWWSARPIFGTLLTSLALFGLGAATLSGYVVGAQSFHLAEGALLTHGLAVMSGGILHVTLHQTVPEGFQPGYRHGAWYSGVGAILAMGLLFTAPIGPSHGPEEAFLQFFQESSLALLIGFVAAGLVQAYLPRAGVDWLARGGVLLQSFKGMVFGIPLPVCSCGVVPVYDSLTRRGAPMAAGVAFLVATPELGLDALLLSFPLLGPEVTLARLLAAMGVALAAGCVLGWVLPEPGLTEAGGGLESPPPSSCCGPKPEPEPVSSCCGPKPDPEPESSCCGPKPDPEPESSCCGPKPEPEPESSCCGPKPEPEPESSCCGPKPEPEPESSCCGPKPELDVEAPSSCCDAPDELLDAPVPSPDQGTFLPALRYGLEELVDKTGPWILAGLCVAAILAPRVDLGALASLPVAAQIGLMTLIGIPLYVCASGATPIAAVLLTKGMSPGAVLAFLLAGPVTNVTTFGVLHRLHGRRAATVFVVVLIACCLLAGGLSEWALAGVSLPSLGDHAGHAGHDHEAPLGWFSLGTSGLLGLVFLASFLRKGPRHLASLVFHNLSRGVDLDSGSSSGDSCCA